ncbi:tyrosine-type recombinase/integrase [Vibrio astriarenae]|uniref:Tyrosine-type recombinase/integrase n=1 Tax=Vibrio astriarenae TaxID=1481923 RepID=A0A7Z2YDQ1_9VIBR|nr:tyrosine-type recombinase/integrase [Vibrio astriarenae]QIA63557.1 tyrosine-type recombinase/integrase [Vibrio astriarenae]
MDTGFNFTKRALESIEKPKRRTTYRDVGSSKSVQGLVLDALVSGAKVFRYQRKVNGKNIKVKLGEFPTTTVEQAREMARSTATDLANGINPNQQKREARESQTFDDLFDIYVASFELDIKAKKRRASSLKSSKTLYRLHLKAELGKKTINDFDAEKARTFMQGIFTKNGYSKHNHSLTLLKSMFNRAYVEFNPFAKISKVDESLFRRERTLSKEELGQFFNSLSQEKQIYQDCIFLLLLTGQRKSMVLSMRWQEIDLDNRRWVIPASKNKSKKAHSVPLPHEAMKILTRRSNEAQLNQEFVFPSARSHVGHITDKSGKGGFWQRVTDRIGMYAPDNQEKHLTVHDLRRTLATYQVTSGGSIQATSKLLGHSNISITNDVYAHLSDDSVRETLENTVSYMLGDSLQTKLGRIKQDIDSLPIEAKQELKSYIEESVNSVTYRA